MFEKISLKLSVKNMTITVQKTKKRRGGSVATNRETKKDTSPQ